ncbi:AAA family ATPase [Citricoccus sp. SGAir0253]|uniref:AAA family ATPase n=1 Tax=Citricoccus sp. SGAir0253 TaxID=2567881 RepID=UPI00143D548A|nr:AAA family ATPase [Citricoccus sp. SGAir0253]
MKITEVHIENFRAHADTKIALSTFGCIIGENSVGKSSLFHAIHFACTGTTPKRVTDHDFGNPDLPIRVTLTLEDITEGDLLRVPETHRVDVRNVVRNGSLTLQREIQRGGRATLMCAKPAPKDARYSKSALDTAVASKRGAALREAAVQALPELEDKLPDSPKKADVDQAYEEVIAELPADALVDEMHPAPTGISSPTSKLFPEVIYIEAVKDADAEVKTSDSATFGKLLGLLLNEIASELTDLEDHFSAVREKLSRISGEDQDPEEEDPRLKKVVSIEDTIQKFVQESFPDVTLRMNVPAPDLKTILSGANLEIDDGHSGPLSSKGDGLKRTVAFAILRAYTELRGAPSNASENPQESPSTPTSAYLLLFEEPELYLHPRAQRQLLQALGKFAREHQVMVTTHSPGFLEPTSTATFTKLRKCAGEVVPHLVDVSSETSLRDAFQLICHENNEAAFFADTVVLVEGDSDVFTFPHLARVLDTKWNHIERNVMFVQTGGKGGIKRYREFFEKFDSTVHVITDLDVMVEGFGHLTSTPELKRQHSDLMGKVDNLIEEQENPPGPNSKQLSNIVANRTARQLWDEAQAALQDWDAAPSADTARRITEPLETLFEKGSKNQKLLALRAEEKEIGDELTKLLSGLAEERVYVLRRGALETYFGTFTSGDDKVAAAMQFCESTSTERALEGWHGDDGKDVVKELRSILGAVFAQV